MWTVEARYIFIGSPFLTETNVSPTYQPMQEYMNFAYISIQVRFLLELSGEVSTC